MNEASGNVSALNVTATAPSRRTSRTTPDYDRRKRRMVQITVFWHIANSPCLFPVFLINSKAMFRSCEK